MAESGLIEASMGAEKDKQRGNSLRQLLHPSMRRVLTIGVVLAVFQQWCGINVIFNYAQEIFSAAGYGVSDILMNIVVTGIVLLIIVVLAIACYAMSLAPVMWVVISEIFPNAVRGAAMAVATFALWGACFILTYTFPLLNSSLGAAGTFWIYGVFCLLGFVFTWKYVPETKNKSLEEIERELIK